MVQLLKQSSSSNTPDKKLQEAYQKTPELVNFETDKSRDFGILRYSDETPEAVRFGGVEFYLVDVRAPRRL